ncbi:MAG: dihydrodipicolinate synthase family protein [Acidobacteriota bacterium]
MLRLQGITPVMACPFQEDEVVDEAGLRKQIDFCIDRRPAAICGPGFGSEFYKLSDPERYRFAEVLVEQARQRVPVIVSTGSGSLHNTIEFSRYAERLGADCLMVVPPQRVALPASEVIHFFSRLCDAVQLPVMLQDADFTGAGLPAAVFIDLAKRHGNFLFAKLEVPLPGRKCVEIIEGSEGRVQIIYGLGGVAMMDGLAHGATAMMPGTALIEVYNRIFTCYQDGRIEEAKSIFYRLLPYLTFALQHLELAVSIEKRVMVRRGLFTSARMRRPTLFLDDQYESQMNELVDMTLVLAEECQRASLLEASRGL